MPRHLEQVGRLTARLQDHAQNFQSPPGFPLVGAFKADKIYKIQFISLNRRPHAAERS
jgi:hypothetical protein